MPDEQEIRREFEEDQRASALDQARSAVKGIAKEAVKKKIKEAVKKKIALLIAKLLVAISPILFKVGLVIFVISIVVIILISIIGGGATCTELASIKEKYPADYDSLENAAKAVNRTLDLGCRESYLDKPTGAGPLYIYRK